MEKICKSRNKPEPCCEICGIKTWKNFPFQNIAEIDHIDHDKTKSGVKDLRVICPNCHAHTTTRFHSVKKNHPSKKEFAVDKKNLITAEKDIFVRNDMKKAYRRIYGLSRKPPINTIRLDDVFAGKVPHSKTGAIVTRFIGEGHKKPECECCGLKEWKNIPISLFLQGHHMNMQTFDYRLENLEILCPNCHATRHTFADLKNPNFTGKKKLRKFCNIVLTTFPEKWAPTIVHKKRK